MRRNLSVWPALLALCFGAYAEPTFFDREFVRSRKALLETQAQPRSVVHAYQCFELRDRLSEPEDLERLLGDLLKSAVSCAVLKSHAEWFQASIELDRAELSRAKSRLRNLGFLFDWWVIGPFDNEGKSGFDRVYPPEGEINFSASHQGKERKVAWRPFPPINEYGYQDFSAIYRPNLQVCAYAVAGLESDREQQAAVRLGSDDAIRVWLNGKPLLSNPAYRPACFDQDVAGCLLRKGLNYILVKVCQKDGGWGFRLRLTAPSGGRLPGVRALSPERLKERKFEPADGDLPKVDVASPLEDLRAYVSQNADSPEAHSNLGFLLQMTHSYDDSEQAHVAEYERALELNHANTTALMRLAEVSPDHNRIRTCYKKILEPDPNFAPALYGLSGYYSRRGDKVRQIELLRRALEADPNYYPAELVLAYEYSFLPLRGLSRRMLQPLKERLPGVSWAEYQVGVVAEALGYRRESKEAYTGYLRAHWTNNSVRQYLLEYAFDEKDLKQCLRLYDEMLEAQPERLDLRRSKAILLANNGKLGEAMAELRSCLAVCPEDAESLQLLGDYYHRQGDAKTAIESWRRSLDFHPQNPNLSEYLEFCTTEEDAFDVPYLADAQVLAQKGVDAAKYAEDPAVCLACNVVEKLHPNGTSSQVTQRVIRVLTEPGAQFQRFHRVYYTASKETAEIESYRVIRKDGRELRSGEVDERRVVEGEHNTFYDYRVKILRLPQLEAGDVIEIRYRVSDVATRNYFGEHFGHIEVFRETLPVLAKKYVLIAPTGRKLFYHQEKMPAPEVRENDFRTYIWHAEDVPGIPNEPMAPPVTAFAPYVHVSSFRSWDEVARYYANMIRDQFQMDAAARDEVKSITEGKKGDQEKIQALYHYLSQKTRYVGLEFGIHGYLPYPAYQVFSRKYGDCKDKAVLLASMLREAGIDSQVALVRTRFRGALHPEPASLSAFDHAICYVPGHDLWLDCTTEFNGTRELPDMNRGALALLIGPNQQDALRTPPLSKAAENRIALDIKAVLLPGGELKGKGKEHVTGSHCPQFRYAYKQPTRERIIFEGMFRGFHPGSKVSEAKFSNLDDLEKPVDVDFEFSIPLFAQARENELLWTPTLFPQQLVRQYAPLSKRELPLNLYVPWSRVLDLRIELPEGAEVLYLPRSAQETSKFGEFSFDVKAEKSAVVVREEVSMNGQIVPPEEYPGFRDFLHRIDDKLSENARIRLPEPKPKEPAKTP
jgi:tetratricopeptide (TPR) repeat protein/transglutaminase-like putative cysteine protease